MWKRIDRACGLTVRSLGEYLDGTLPLRRRRALEAHLRACAACGREREAMRRTVALLTGLPRPELSADFDAALQARLAAVEGAGRGRSGSRLHVPEALLPGSRYLRAPWPSPFQRLAPAGAIAAAALALAVWNLQPWREISPAPSSPPAYVSVLVREHQMLNAGSDMNATVVGHNLNGDLLGDGDEE